MPALRCPMLGARRTKSRVVKLENSLKKEILKGKDDVYTLEREISQL
jgi:hypothetical protein